MIADRTIPPEVALPLIADRCQRLRRDLELGFVDGLILGIVADLTNAVEQLAAQIQAHGEDDGRHRS